ncbi:MAG: uncharacterized SAM-binding protein YcdF (DUF218 family) [Hyphomicrobiaceae bacterium]|jgi:uncharacterized SAM-binding protein YcdF (DUF218 family)
MLFVLSKLVYGLIAPSSICLLLIGSGLLLGFRSHWRVVGRRLSIAGFVLLLVFGFSPLAKWLAKPLDDRFAAAKLPGTEAVTHIILLGGFELADIANWRQQMATNASGERLLAIVPLARRFPKAKIVFSGGHGWLLGKDDNAISAIKSVMGYLVASGVARDRILLEGRSRNNWQNALFVKELLEQRKTACPCGFLLVTSAWHMSRSIGIFRQTGFAGADRQLYAHPVDFRTLGGSDMWVPFRSLQSGLRLMDVVVKEWTGLVAYRLMGRTQVLWPKP